MALYDNGASFQGGNLVVNGTGKVDNLNAEKLQGKTPSDFINKDSDTGLTQSGKTITLTGVTVAASSSAFNVSNGSIDLGSSEVKIGNLTIKSSDNGNGILIGIN